MNAQAETEAPKTKVRKWGRPKLLQCELRSFQIKVGFTPAQFAVIESRAESAGLPEAELIRRIAINAEVRTMPSINRTALMELSRIGTNINQLAKVANTTNSTLFLTEISEVLVQLKVLGEAIVSDKR